MSRTIHDHWLVGMCTSVLKEEFVNAYKNDINFVLGDWLPFLGKPKLPTKMEALKLVLFLRTKVGKKIVG